jgi:TIR domain
MSYLRPEFEYDVFISYAHNDDQPVLGEKWVTELDNELRTLVLEYLGQEPAFWRDPDIRNNEDYREKIAARLAKTATLLTVVSESFFERPWCQLELEEFCRNAESRLGLRVGEKVRIFKVFKSEINRQTFPKHFEGTERYVFYGKVPDESDKGIHTYRPSFGGQQRRLYYFALDELAKDIVATLRLIREVTAQGGTAPTTPATVQSGVKPATVYLAETTEDQETARSSIKKELQDRNITVFPQGDLPYRGSQFEPQVREYLQKADLSVHIFGKDAGFVPEGRQRPHTWLQHDLALERGADQDFRRILWWPSALESPEPRQTEYLQSLQNDVSVQRGAEILRDRLEELKTEMLNLLERIKKRKEERLKPPAPTPVAVAAGATPAAASAAAPAVATVSGEPLTIYLIGDAQDVQSPVFQALQNYLLDQGHEPRIAPVCDNAKEARKNHEMLLQYSDAYLIYFGAGSGQWLQTKLNDFMRLSSKRKTPLMGKATYIAPPLTDEKRTFRSNEAKPIGNGAEFDPKPISDFLQNLKRPPGR